MGNEKSVGKSGKIGEGIFAEKLLDAQEKAAKENAAKSGSAVAAEQLPDLSKIEVNEIVIPRYDGEKAKIEASETKQYAEAAGSKLTQVRENLEKIRNEIHRIERDPDSAFSATAKQTLAALKAAEVAETAKERQLLSIKDEAVKSHIEFSALLEEIRGTDPSHLGEVQEILFRVCNLGRYRLAAEEEIEAAKKPEGRWPAGTIFFEGKIYFSSFAEKSSGQKALEAELRKLTDAAKNSKAASIKMRGNADLSGFEAGKSGLYYFFSPKRTEGERRFFEGHALIEVKDLNKGKKDREGKPRKPFVVVEIKDAIGSLSWMVSDRWILYFWIKQGRVVTKEDNRLEKDEFDRAVRLIRTLRALYAVWRKGLNPEAAKKEEKPEGPLFTTPAADMTDVVVERVAPVPEKKPKKTKKA